MSSIRLKHASGNSMSLAAPGTNPASNLELKLPHTIGSANQLLKVDGSGQHGWATDSTTDSTKLPLAGGTLTGTLNVDSGSSGMIDFGDTGSAFGRLYADSTGTFVGSKTQNYLWLRTNNVQRIKVSDTSAATSIGGAFTFNAMLTTQGDISGGLLMLKASENTNRFFVSGNDTSGCEVNLYDDSGGQRGIVGVSSSEFFLKAPNNSAPLTFYTHNGSSIGERLRITSAGLVGINCTPNKQLEVKGTDVAFRLLSTVATGRIGMEFYDTSAQKGYFGYASSSNDEMSIQQNEAADLWFYVNGGERLRVKSDGSIRVDGPTAATHGLRFTPNGWNGYDNRIGYCGSSGADFWWSSNWNPTDGSRDHSGYATNYIRQNISSGYLSFGTGPVNTSASERLRITAGGVVDVKHYLFMGRASDPRIYAGSGVGLNIDGQALYLNRYVSSDIRLVDGGGDVCIGTGSSTSRLTLSSGGSANAVSIRNTTGGNGNVGILFSTQDHSGGREKAAIYHQETHGQAHYGGDFIFCLNTATGSAAQVGPSDEKMRLRRSGELYINTSSSVDGNTTKGIHVYNSGGSTASFKRAQNGAGVRFIHGTTLSGWIEFNSNNTVSYTSASDYRLKENNVAISDGIARVKNLKPYRFNWKAEPDKTVDGFFAHEAQEVVPEAVTRSKDRVVTEDDLSTGYIKPPMKVGDPIHQSMDNAKLIPLLTAALKEAITKIETLETKVAALEAG